MSKKQLEVKFITDLPQEKYALEQSTYTLPLETTVDKLNQLLSNLLKIKEKFSFYIDGLKFTTSFKDFFSTVHPVSTETIVEVTYAHDINEPQLKNTIKEDEWIKKITLLKEMKYDAKNHKNYVAALFNGVVSFYSSDNKKLFTLENTNSLDENALAMITDIAFFKSMKDDNNILIRLMRNSTSTFEIFDINSKKQTSSLVFSGSKEDDEFYNAVAVNEGNFDLFALGGCFDSAGVLSLFKIPDDISLNDQHSAKKRKISKMKLEPIYTFNSNVHNSQVEACAWLNAEQIITCGDDYNINIFNTVSNNLYMAYNTNYKNPTSVLKLSNETFVTSYQDGSIKLYDIRTGNKSVLQFKDKNFCGYISQLSRCNDRDQFPNTFSSSCYDSSIKVWDTRSTSPLYKVETKGTEKNYTVCFNGNDTLLSGGDGSQINIYNY